MENSAFARWIINDASKNAFLFVCCTVLQKSRTDRGSLWFVILWCPQAEHMEFRIGSP